MLIDIFHRNQTIVEEYDIFCVENCIKQVLEYYDIKNPELYLDASMNLILKKNEILNLNLGIFKEEEFVLPQYTDKIQRYEGETFDLVWKKNLDYIQRGIPVITYVDVHYLQYIPQHGQNHGIHTIILAGYDETQQKPIVIDWGTFFAYKGEMDFNYYYASRDSKNEYDESRYSGIPINNAWIIVEKDGWNAAPEALIKNVSELSLKQYYNSKNHDAGIYAVRELIQILKDSRNYSKENKNVFLTNLHFVLYPVVKRKGWFHHYLSIASGTVKAGEIEQCFKQFSIIYDEWQVILSFIIRGMYRDIDTTIEQLILKFDNVRIKEEEFYNTLSNVSSIL